MKNTHVVIREKLNERNWTLEIFSKVLSEKLGRERDPISIAQLSQLLNYKADWRRDTMYAIMDIFKLPYNELNDVFPPKTAPAWRSREKKTQDSKPQVIVIKVTLPPDAVPYEPQIEMCYDGGEAV